MRGLESMKDRFGIGWRPELAAGIFAHLDRIDLVEVIAEDYYTASPDELRSLETLARLVPVTLHGTSMGLASAVPVETSRLDAMARLAGRVKPESWSEHLAFVRGGGIEIGHLAAPPRTSATVEGAAANLRRASAVVGSLPLVENIATLIDPPASSLDEAAWIGQILRASGCPLLLDLHNVYANGRNHGQQPSDLARRLAGNRIGLIHISGGHWIPAPGGSPRLLDDHRHDVPDEVFALLEDSAALSPSPMTVILERDGNYPSMSRLLAQLDRARQAVARGRSRP